MTHMTHKDRDWEDPDAYARYDGETERYYALACPKEDEDPEPDGVLRCPDCERPTQSGEVCSDCQEERAAGFNRREEGEP